MTNVLLSGLLGRKAGGFPGFHPASQVADARNALKKFHAYSAIRSEMAGEANWARAILKSGITLLVGEFQVRPDRQHAKGDVQSAAG